MIGNYKNNGAEWKRKASLYGLLEPVFRIHKSPLFELFKIASSNVDFCFGGQCSVIAANILSGGHFFNLLPKISIQNKLDTSLTNKQLEYYE